MKLSREFTNGVIIFVLIGAYFLLLEVLGWADQFYLRLLNLFIVVYGVNRTLTANYKDNMQGYFTNLMSAFRTAMIGAVLGLISLMVYIHIKGGGPYIHQLSKGFLFGGGDPTVFEYSVGLALEATAGSMIISYCLMQYWKNKFETINKVDRK
ncbi:MAG TPA: hypothetical protein VF677_00845 [Flavobacterium sp.]|jgi:hypothetical protein